MDSFMIQLWAIQLLIFTDGVSFGNFRHAVVDSSQVLVYVGVCFRADIDSGIIGAYCWGGAFPS